MFEKTKQNKTSIYMNINKSMEVYIPNINKSPKKWWLCRLVGREGLRGLDLIKIVDSLFFVV